MSSVDRAKLCVVRRGVSIVVGLVALGACSGGSDDVLPESSTPVSDPVTDAVTADDGDLFSESDVSSDEDGQGAGVVTTVAVETTVADQTTTATPTSTTVASDESGNGAATDTGTGGGSTGETDGSGNTGAETTGTADGSGGAGSGSSTGGADGDTATGGGNSTSTVTAADIDRAVLLDQAELGALGLGSDWDIQIEIEPALGEDDGAPCDLGLLLSFEQLYSDATDPDAHEFEQILVPGAGGDAVGVVRGLPDCEELTSELGDDGRLIEVDTATVPALGFTVGSQLGDEQLSWFGADVGGMAVLVFHLGDPSSVTSVQSAFEQLLADVAAGT